MFIAISDDDQVTGYDDFNEYMQFHDNVVRLQYAILNVPGTLRIIDDAELAEWLAEYEKEAAAEKAHIKSYSL